MNLRNYIFSTAMICLWAIIGVSCQKSNDSSQETAPNIAVAEASETVQENCSFCGMDTQKHPKWRIQAFFEQQSLSFCSPKCFFMHCHQQKVSPDSALAMDYYDVKLFDASKGFFVVGSDILGPMGHDLIPFAEVAAAQEFAQDHAGKQVVSFQEVDSLVIFGL